MGGYLAKTFCSNAYCPRIRRIPVTPDMEIDEETAPPLLKLDKREALRDACGSYWCPECEWRAHLLDWGKAHDWPALECPPYAVAPGRQSWELATKLGIDAYAHALRDVILIVEEI